MNEDSVNINPGTSDLLVYLVGSDKSHPDAGRRLVLWEVRLFKSTAHCLRGHSVDRWSSNAIPKDQVRGSGHRVSHVPHLPGDIANGRQHTREYCYCSGDTPAGDRNEAELERSVSRIVRPLLADSGHLIQPDFAHLNVR